MTAQTLDIRPADVLFVWSRGIVSDAIESITDGPSHVALFIDASTLCEAQGLRRIGDVPFSFYTSSKTAGAELRSSGRSERLEICRDMTLTDADRSEMVAYAKTFYGDRYDYALIPLEAAHYVLGVKLSWYREHRRFICSTYVSDVAEHVGRQWSKVANPAPEDVYDGGALQSLYVWRNGVWVTESPMGSA